MLYLEYRMPKKRNDMFDLRTARKRKGLTQEKAALSLGVTQAYLSMLENNRRPVPANQLSRVVEVYGLSYAALPLRGQESWHQLQNRTIASQLAALGYPGFSYMNTNRPQWNPAELLVAALTKNELESRVIEGLTWLVYAFTNMNWDWVTREAKANDVTNRLGFVVTLARNLAERKANCSVAETMRTVEKRLRPSTLVREETLCHDQMTQAERKWLEERRSLEARQWHVLSDLTPEHLQHVT
jgi:transcriptional regulator with XRE-family HTH domain